MASGPSLHGKLVGKKWRQWRILFSWLPNSLWMVTAATKLTFVPWKKSYEQPRQLIKKQRHITLPTKVCIVKTVVFPEVMYGCESWTIKKAEHRGIDAFQLCWRKLLRVSWTAGRSNQSILKEITLNIHWKDNAEAPILWPPDVKC